VPAGQGEQDAPSAPAKKPALHKHSASSRLATAEVLCWGHRMHVASEVAAGALE